MDTERVSQRASCSFGSAFRPWQGKGSKGRGCETMHSRSRAAAAAVAAEGGGGSAGDGGGKEVFTEINYTTQLKSSGEWLSGPNNSPEFIGGALRPARGGNEGQPML